MSRHRKAVTTAIFTYGQSVVGMLLGLVVTRIVLAKLGRDTYGLWVASGALLAYAGFADLGILNVLPWMIAEADGKKDDKHLRALMSHGFVFSLLASIGFAGVATGLWHFYPKLLHLSEGDRSLLVGPLFIVVGLTAATFPFRTFTALLTGKQDAAYLGISGLTQVFLSGGLTLGLVWSGYGLYSLAIGAALPPLLSASAALLRSRVVFGAIVTGWTRPHRPLLRRLAVDGFGAWLTSFGYSMAAASDPVILSYVGYREAVPNFAISARLALTLTQFAWILPDAGLVGLAQLGAEGTKERTREIAFAIVRLNLIVAGAVATAVLASSGSFVRIWVGPDYFLGTRFNAILAINAILACTIHGVSTVASVLGKRLEVGLSLIANGVVHIVFATILGKHFGVYGIVLATLFSGATTCLPISAILLRPTIGASVRELWSSVLAPWVFRFLPIAVLALFVGRFCTPQPLLVVVPLCALLGMAYLAWMRPLYRDLPLGPRLVKLLRALRLLENVSTSQ